MMRINVDERRRLPSISPIRRRYERTPFSKRSRLACSEKALTSYCSVQNTDGTAGNQYYIDINIYALHARRELQEAELSSKETARSANEVQNWEIDFPLAGPSPTTASEFLSSHKLGTKVG